MDKSIFKYILRYSLRQQITLTLMAAASFPFLYAFYELPKLIINGAILGDGGPFPVAIMGIELNQTIFLFLLCGVFLLLVIVNQGFKYVINVYKGLAGERMLRRLRYDLYSRVLRFPLPTFRRLSQGEIIPMVTQEVEPLGGFIGNAYSLPAFQGGQLIVILAFLFIQNPIMAAAAVALYPLQVYIIPKLQKRVNQLGKQRVQLVRQLSDRIGETVQGVQEIHAHDTSNLERAQFSHRLGVIFDVRYQIYRRKFIIKFLNNFIQQLGPFFFYSIGGYLVIVCSLDIGTLMAAVAAHKDLASPWKELLNYYQMREDAKIKYDQVVSQFEPSGMREEEFQTLQPDNVGRLEGELAASNLTLVDDQDVNVIDSISVRLNTNDHIAVVGPSGSGKEDLMLLLSRLLDPTRGSISVGGKDFAGLSEAITGRRISYVGQGGYLFSSSLGDNLFYGLKHRPVTASENSAYAQFAAEARRAGNADDPLEVNWIDFASIGVEGPDELRSEGLNVLKMVDLDDDVYRLGLRGTIDPDTQVELANAILKARLELRGRLQDPEIAPLIEPFDRDKYNSNATVGENLLFGHPTGDAFKVERLAENEYVLSVIDKVGLTGTMLSIGYQVAATMVELFADLPPDHELFQQFSFISSDDLPDVQAMIARVNRDNLETLEQEDRARLLSLPFMLIPARHRLGLINEDIQTKLINARAVFIDELPDELAGYVEIFDPDSYNSAATLQDNILFGKIAYGQAESAERVGQLVSDVVNELGLRDLVMEAGLNFNVGIGGSRLISGQRQKATLARAILKQPDILIISEATAMLDTSVQGRIMKNLRREFAGRGMIWSLHRAELAQEFDRILVMKAGKIVEQGTFAELNREGTFLKELLSN